MERSAGRILLAIQPAFLEGALATLLSAQLDAEVVQLGASGALADHGDYDAAVVSDRLPDDIRAVVVITLPDTRGTAGTGTVRTGGVIHSVSIAGPDRVIELLEQYAPRSLRRVHEGSGEAAVGFAHQGHARPAATGANGMGR